MKLIPLSQGLFSQVDDEDFERLNKYKWSASRTGDTFYAIRNNGYGKNQQRKMIIMHREIMDFPSSKIDHHDRNGLNNQKENLRICNNSQNLCNSKLHKNSTTGFRGVSFYKRTGKYRACICKNNNQHHLGYYITPEGAARSYNAAASKLHGEFAQLNFCHSNAQPHNKEMSK